MEASDSITRDWYLVYCKPRQELSARVNLERQGYEVYLPMVNCRKRSGSQRVSKFEPMFPRYLFIRLAKGLDSWAPIRSTIGVSHLVRFGLELAQVPENLIIGLKAGANSEGYFEAKQIEIKPGDRFRITEGVMEGYEGIVLARTGKERVRLLINSINSSMFNFEVPDDQLELIG